MGLYNPPPVALEQPKANTASHYAINAATTSTALLAVNLDRLGATLFNNSTARLYVKLGATATTTDFTFPLEPNGYYEVPFGYTGSIAGVWAAVNGNALISEFL
ncbi:hypothetical protein [Myxacorys almedinensis]|uniref:Uncharacterized protein n=1 Tax=Myxacorys almedinensis A TaxID=2690445 RepID=A0A8J8CM23_9CYAN|nr:hypothetical protein [Myxacorys almedinensis]NDJ16787.1 hypothetical protein [Myxacorys almedinensis A]